MSNFGTEDWDFIESRRCFLVSGQGPLYFYHRVQGQYVTSSLGASNMMDDRCIKGVQLLNYLKSFEEAFKTYLFEKAYNLRLA